MPRKKKQIFNRNNSVKFLLVRGNAQAVNADGETLQSILVPVSKNYKAGTSLLMPDISALLDTKVDDKDNTEPDLKKIMDSFSNPDSDLIVEELPSKVRKMNLKETSKKAYIFNEEDEAESADEFSDDSSQFSDDSEDPKFMDEFQELAIDPNCPEAVKLYNAKYEKVVLEEYGEDQIGSLDFEDIGGYLSTSSRRITDLVNKAENPEEEEFVFGNCEKDMKEKILNYAEDSGDEEVVEIVTEKPLEYDCESILSTYSNIYNHPTVIREEKIKKIQIPNNPLKRKLTKSQLKTLISERESDDESDDISISTASNVRVKGETPEERKERKSLFKEIKRESRMLKKESKLAFKRGKELQTSEALNARRNAGIRLL